MKTEEFCTFLRDVRVSSGVSITDLSKKYGWHRNTIGSYEKDRLCDVEYLLALSKECGVSLNDLLTERIKYGFLQDTPEFKAPGFQFSDLLGFEKESKDGVKYATIQTRQFEPLIQAGSVVEIDTKNTEHFNNHQLVAFKNERNEVSVCRVVEHNGALFLLSMTPGPELIEFTPSNFNILGIVLSSRLIFESRSGN